MYEAYRVRREFQWMGWMYTPAEQAQGKPCDCQCAQIQDVADPINGMILRQTTRQESLSMNGCTGLSGTICTCPDAGYCVCRLKPWLMAGDIWLVMAGDPRKEYILQQRFATPDAAIPSVDELLKYEQYTRLLAEPKVLVPA